MSITRLPSHALHSAQTCKFLRVATQEHHVWLDQVRNYLRETPSLRLLSLPVGSLSTEDLYCFAIRQAKIRIRWDQPPNPKDQFIHVASFDLHGSSGLLPGGNLGLWVFDYTGAINPFHTDLQARSRSNGPLRVGSMGAGRWLTGGLIQTTCPHPVIAYFGTAE